MMAIEVVLLTYLLISTFHRLASVRTFARPLNEVNYGLEMRTVAVYICIPVRKRTDFMSFLHMLPNGRKRK